MPNQSVRSVQKSQRSAPPNLLHRSKRGRGRAGNFVDRFSTQQNHLESMNNSQSDNLSNATIQKHSANGISSIESDCNPTEVVDDSISQPGPTVNPNAEKEKIIKLQAELRSTIEHLNTFKKTVTTLEKDLAHSKLTITVLQDKISCLQKELNLQKQENDGLIKANEQLEHKMAKTDNKLPKFVVRLSKSLDKKYITLALAVERKLASWASAESMEVYNTMDDIKKRNWTGRFETVKDFGIRSVTLATVADNDKNNYNFVPTFFHAIFASANLFFIPSFISIEVVIADHLNDIFNEHIWKPFCSDDTIRSQTIAALSTNTVLINKCKQLLSDSLSNRKRLVWDELFHKLRYFSLTSSHDKKRRFHFIPRNRKL